jgi:hypothetical protein
MIANTANIARIRGADFLAHGQRRGQVLAEFCSVGNIGNELRIRLSAMS